MADITARGKIPLLVGGTMLYFKALREGLSPLPQADAALRAELDAEIAQHGIEHLHAKLAEVDPETAARLHSTDTQRIQRAMEIYRLSGQPMSVLIKQQEQDRTALPHPAHCADPFRPRRSAPAHRHALCRYAEAGAGR